MLRLRNEIDELGTQYVENLNNDMTFVAFSEAELLGVPAEFLKVNSTHTLLFVF